MADSASGCGGGIATVADLDIAAARALSGPAWLVERRSAAAESFTAQPVPSPEAEEWRYSPIAQLDLDRYELAPSQQQRSAASNSVAAGVGGVGGVVADGFAGDEVIAVIECLNGRPIATEGTEALAVAGVTVGSLLDRGDGAELLGSVAAEAADYFTLLNDAFAPAPVVVDVADGVRLSGTVLIRNHTIGPPVAGTSAAAAGKATASTANPVACFPRLVVRVGRDAEVRILDLQRSVGRALVVPVVELDVGDASRLGYLNIQDLAGDSWQLASHTARVARDATLVAAVAGLGGAYARTRADTRLLGRGASGDLLSLYFGEREQTLDFRTFQDHAAPDTTSNLLYKGAVGDSSRSIYTGLIRVRPNARGTNAFQTNRNLKLSKDAWAESVPNLEIENNDVRCSHASTVSPVDTDQVFYLESRGVPTAQAERLIVAGFFDEVLTVLPVPVAEPMLRSAIVAKLGRMAA